MKESKPFTKDVLRETLNNIKVGFPVIRRNISMFPIEKQESSNLKYLDFTEQVNLGTVKVRELNDLGSVPQLALENSNSLPVFILDGEHLSGAKQNRTVNLSILVPPKTSMKIPVSCVEEGRWAHTSEHFFSEGELHFNRGRRLKARNIARSLKDRLSRNVDQGEVWDAIKEKERIMQSRSNTHSMKEIYNKNIEQLDFFESKIEPTPKQVGALYAIGPKILGFDIFDQTKTLKQHIRKLTRSVAIDAIEDLKDISKRPSLDEVKEFIDSFLTLEVDRYRAIGLGTDVRAYNQHLTLSALEYDRCCVHLAGFSVQSNDRGSRLRRENFYRSA